MLVNDFISIFVPPDALDAFDTVKGRSEAEVMEAVNPPSKRSAAATSLVRDPLNTMQAILLEDTGPEQHVDYDHQNSSRESRRQSRHYRKEMMRKQLESR